MQSVAAALDRLGELAASPTVARLAAAFDAAGHELALVGGPVRDAFLGRSTNDLDFTTDATPDEIIAIVKPIAEAHWDIGRAFGTIGAKIAGETVEITTYRADSYDGDSRKPEVVFGTSLDDDLIRRDFTVNALALRLPQLALVDPSAVLRTSSPRPSARRPHQSSRSATIRSGCSAPHASRPSSGSTSKRARASR
jgi:poly(A) polymerase